MLKAKTKLEMRNRATEQRMSQDKGGSDTTILPQVIKTPAEHVTITESPIELKSAFDHLQTSQSIHLHSSLFKPKKSEQGIGQKLSPGKYKLLQGKPDLSNTKRNANYFSTFNSKNNPLEWDKKVASRFAKPGEKLPAIHSGTGTGIHPDITIERDEDSCPSPTRTFTNTDDYTDEQKRQYMAT